MTGGDDPHKYERLGLRQLICDQCKETSWLREDQFIFIRTSVDPEEDLRDGDDAIVCSEECANDLVTAESELRRWPPSRWFASYRDATPVLLPVHLHAVLDELECDERELAEKVYPDAFKK